MNLNIRLAFRFLWKNKLYSFINIAGLSLGLACCFIILLHIRYETGFDQFHEKKDRLAVVMHDDWSYTPFVMADALPGFFPEIEKTVRFAGLDWSGFYILTDKGYVRDHNIIYSDSTFFDIFTFPLVNGDPTKILRSPDRIMMAESKALKYYGTTDVAGRTITARIFNENHVFTIEGVFKDMPEQSNFHAGFITSIHFGLKIMGENMRHNWGANSMQTYVLLKKPEQIKTVSDRFPDFVQKVVPKGPEEQKFNYSLQPITRIHLYSKNPGAIMEPQSSITRVIIFASIAILVLAIAVINFILLSLALSYQRIKEFGIRKVVGASHGDLVSLVRTEFLIVFILAAQISLMIVELAIPWFKSHLGLVVYKGIFSNAGLLAAFLVLVFILGFLSSLYITLNVSRVAPIDSLRSKLPSPRSLVPARSALFILQFTIMAGLLICLLVMQKQLWLVRNKDLGYRKEELLSIKVPQFANLFSGINNTSDKYKLFTEELKKVPGIRSVSGANYIPPTDQWWLSYYKLPGSDEKFDLEQIQGDYGLVETLGIKMVAGRIFSPEYGSDSSAILINEAAVRKMGFKSAEEAIDTYIITDGGDKPVRFNIIGVFSDFHIRSLYDEIKPMSVFYNTQIIQQLAVRLEAGDNRKTIGDLKKLWSTVYPDDPIEITYVDKGLHESYVKDDQAYSLISMFSFMSLVIALMGLFGLSTNAVERRTKETGIRKVNGAQPADILIVLSKQFLIWIMLAFCIAIPASWYAMHRWLQHFAYRTEISWWVYLAALTISIAIALITIAWQTYRAARMNPVEALRYE
jgi:putative ABC transport system permease protein